MSHSSVMRRLTSVITVTMLAISLIAPVGCRRTAPPVSESDWRSHMSSPKDVKRNWVLPDNTMLAEIARPAEWPLELAPCYAYEIYDPRTDKSTNIVPADYTACLRTISDKEVEFVAGNFTGARYLLHYDLAKRRLSEQPAWYAADREQWFGLTNAYCDWQGATLTTAGIDLKPTGYPTPTVYFVVRPQAEQDELLLEFPGMQPSGGKATPPLRTDGLPPLVSGATYTDGVVGADGTVLPGVTLHLQLTSPDWSHLSFGLIGPRKGPTAHRLLLTLSEKDEPSDLALSFGLPALWDDWREWAAMWRSSGGVCPVVESWPLNGGLRLVKWDVGGDLYGLCDPNEQTTAMLIGLNDAAVPLSIRPERAVLLGDGSGVCPITAWPYLIIIDPVTRTVESEPVDLTVGQPVAFGGASSVLASVVSEDDGLRLRFAPGPMPVGGSGPPRITTRLDPAARQLLVRIHSFGGWPEHAAEEMLTLGPLDVTGVPFVTAASLEAGITGADGKSGPGVTLRLTLGSTAWGRLTYRFERRALPSGAPPDTDEGSLVLTFSDRASATDISAIIDRMGLDGQ